MLADLPVLHDFRWNQADPVDYSAYPANRGSHLKGPFLCHDVFDLSLHGKNAIDKGKVQWIQVEIDARFPLQRRRNLGDDPLFRFHDVLLCRIGNRVGNSRRYHGFRVPDGTPYVSILAQRKEHGFVGDQKNLKDRMLQVYRSRFSRSHLPMRRWQKRLLLIIDGFANCYSLSDFDRESKL